MKEGETMITEWIPYIVLLLCVVGVSFFVLGYTIGDSRRYHEKKSTVLEHTQQLQKTYSNGIRVGKREMLDTLVHYKLITEADARAVSEEI